LSRRRIRATITYVKTIIALMVVGGMTTMANAQLVPFFAPGAVAFDPEIAVVTSGVLNDVQGTVSHDRKYVTINAQPSLSSLVALQKFQFQSGGGIVGVGTTVGANGAFTGAANNPRSNPSAINPANQSTLLREGMTRLTPLADNANGAK
jgi:hypothetical protein